jgi:glycerol kinase
MKYILAIDQGTTGSRAVLYDKAGKVAGSAYREFPQIFPKPGWVEHDPEEIWQSVYKAVQTLLRKKPSASIAAIGITNQRETAVLWERRTGRPIYNAIVWQCRRTSARCDALKRKKGVFRTIKKTTGLPIDAYFSATKIEWILKNKKGAMDAARAGDLCFGTTDSWILWKLTGGGAHATDHTNASRTMLYDIDKRRWDKKILKMFNIPASVLPEVKNSSGLFGKTVKTGALPAGVPITGIAGDQQAALFGQGCFEPGQMKNTYGTGCFVLLNTGKKRPVSKHGLITTIGCGPKGEPVYVLEGSIFIAGAAIQWLRDGLKLLSEAGASEKMAYKAGENAGVYFVPALVGLGAPYWDQDARGAILGITRGVKSEHIVRAALEAMAYQTRDVLDAMKRDSGLKVKELKVDGGAAANDFLCQFQADIISANVARPEIIETTASGAAYLAGLAAGYWSNARAIKRRLKVAKVFKPGLSVKSASALYAGWRGAVERVLS